MLYRGMHTTLALERLQMMQSVSGAIASAFGTKGELPPSVKADMREAYIMEG